MDNEEWSKRETPTKKSREKSDSNKSDKVEPSKWHRLEQESIHEKNESFEGGIEAESHTHIQIPVTFDGVFLSIAFVFDLFFFSFSPFSHSKNSRNLETLFCVQLIEVATDLA